MTLLWKSARPIPPSNTQCIWGHRFPMDKASFEMGSLQAEPRVHIAKTSRQLILISLRLVVVARRQSRCIATGRLSHRCTLQSWSRKVVPRFCDVESPGKNNYRLINEARVQVARETVYSGAASSPSLFCSRFAVECPWARLCSGRKNVWVYKEDDSPGRKVGSDLRDNAGTGFSLRIDPHLLPFDVYYWILLACSVSPREISSWFRYANNERGTTTFLWAFAECYFPLAFSGFISQFFLAFFFVDNSVILWMYLDIRICNCFAVFWI